MQGFIYSCLKKLKIYQLSGVLTTHFITKKTRFVKKKNTSKDLHFIYRFLCLLMNGNALYFFPLNFARYVEKGRNLLFPCFLFYLNTDLTFIAFCVYHPHLLLWIQCLGLGSMKRVKEFTKFRQNEKGYYRSVSFHSVINLANVI